MIMAQRNWDYNTHFQVEYGAYVQASKFNDPTNTNCLRKLDGIYLCPAPNFQGGHQIMDLQKVQLITSLKLVEINITDIVVNAVEKWQNIKD